MNENKNFILAPYLKGVGQIMLQDNAWTGLFFLVAIFLESYIVGLTAVLAVVTGTLTAKLLKYPVEHINAGLYGFSATLVGVAMVTFFKHTPVIWMAIIAGSVLAAMLQHVFIIRKFPGFTFPFIAITWVLYYCFAHIYKLEAMPPPPEESNNFVITSHGFGEIIFQASISSGILFFIGVFIANPVAALYGLAAAVISAALAFYIHEPVAPIAEGLFSFNAVLCAITFGGTRKVDGLYVLAAILLALVIEVIMIKYNCSPYLTIPFVAACWIIVIIKKMLPKSLL